MQSGRGDRLFLTLVTHQGISPEKCTWQPQEGWMLDAFLAQGWFRAKDEIFITHFLHFQQTVFDAIWLRIHLGELQFTPSQQKLINKTTRHFRVERRPYRYTQRAENLFQEYRNSLDFEVAESLATLLGEKDNLFNTQEICVFHEEKLVAMGIYDRGLHAQAGITNFYHPSYKKYSLGKALVLLKLFYAKKEGFHWFYPGYFVPGYFKFDYKLTLCPPHTQWLNIRSQQWQAVQDFKPTSTPLYLTLLHLRQLREFLQNHFQESRILAYRFFDAALWFANEPNRLFGYPALLYLPVWNGYNKKQLVVWCPLRQQYLLIVYSSVYKLFDQAASAFEMLETSLLGIESAEAITPEQLLEKLCNPEA